MKVHAISWWITEEPNSGGTEEFDSWFSEVRRRKIQHATAEKAKENIWGEFYHGLLKLLLPLD